MREKNYIRILAPALALVLLGALSGVMCFSNPGVSRRVRATGHAIVEKVAGPGLQTAKNIKPSRPEPRSRREKFLFDLADAAMERTRHDVTYDPAYVVLDYPGGDVPDDRGVCSDVVIRAYRALGIDLQVDVHEDMKANFKLYPKKWGLKKTDKNIDHRRVANLMVLFARKGQSFDVTDDPADYRPGDLVTWDLNGNGLLHIGVVSLDRSADGRRFKLVHNIGAGPQNEDVLFDWEILGHYRYFGDRTFEDEETDAD